MIRIFLTTLALVPVALALVQSTFKTTCTVPNTTTHYVSSPDSRGTLDILWSCLFTMVACTLTIQHLNVPEQCEGRNPGWWRDLKWALKDTMRSLKWMIITILAPELIIAQSCNQLVAAKMIHSKLQEQALVDRVPWTMTHTIFANMGGFILKSNQQDVPSELKQVGGGEGEVGHAAEEETTIGLVQDNTPQGPGLARIAASITPVTFRSESSVSLPPNPYHLKAIDILNLREHGQLSRLPCITQYEINDKSKANSFIKALAITQISWMLTQILIRSVKKLAVTQLEISVLAFSVCAIIIYCLNWQKPKDVKIAHTVFNYLGELPAHTLRVLWLPTKGKNTQSLSVTISGTLGLVRNASLVGAPIANDYLYDEAESGSNIPFNFYLIGLALGCATFGGIHIAAWHFGFQTETELTIWRVASIWCTVFVIFAFFGTVILMVIVEWCLKTDDYEDLVMDISMRLLTGLYIIGRLALLIEIFRTLFFLPPDAFIATFASNIPHVS